MRNGRAASYLEEVWRGLRATKPISLTNRQAHALAGELYRAWASEPPTSRAMGITLKPGRKGQDPDDWEMEWPAPLEWSGFNLMYGRLHGYA